MRSNSICLLPQDKRIRRRTTITKHKIRAYSKKNKGGDNLSAEISNLSINSVRRQVISRKRNLQCAKSKANSATKISNLTLTLQNQVILKSISTDLLQSIKQLQPNNFKCYLRSTSVSLEMRAKMIDWIIEVMSIYGLSQRTFFLFVALMDTYHDRRKPLWKSDEIHLTGITCMCIAAKIEEPYVMNVKVAATKVSHNTFTELNIVNKEKEIVKALEFNLLHNTPVNALDLHISVAIDSLEKQGEICSSDHWFILRKLKEGSSILLMMACYDYAMRRYSAHILALGSIYGMAMDLSLMYSCKYTSFLAKFIKELQIEQTVLDHVQRSAKDLIELGREFGRRFPGMSNVLNRNLCP